MKKSIGSRIAAENLQVGETYILRAGSGEALVRVKSVSSSGVDVIVDKGQIASVKKGKTYRKGDEYLADPSYADFYEPAV